MQQQQIVTVQQGIWIDRSRLADAGLQDPLEISVAPGEIRIYAAAADVASRLTADEPLLDVAGVLGGPPMSAEQIDRELYDDEATQP